MKTTPESYKIDSNASLICGNICQLPVSENVFCITYLRVYSEPVLARGEVHRRTFTSEILSGEKLPDYTLPKEYYSTLYNSN